LGNQDKACAKSCRRAGYFLQGMRGGSEGHGRMQKMRQGGALRLPALRDVFRHKGAHWLPAVGNTGMTISYA